MLRFQKEFRLSILIFCLTISIGTVWGQTTAFNFQGRLNDGTNPANGRYDLQFKLFDAITGGNQVFATVDRPNLMLVNGVFSTTLDFGASAFDTGTRFVEISVRPNGSPNEYVILGGRQQILSVPFAVRAATAQNAQTLEGQTSGDFIKNSTAAQTANFNITGNGTVGGNLGVGVTPQPGTKLDVGGNATFRTANGNVNIGSPNSETGISIAGTNRADIRFDGTILTLSAGTGTGVPNVTNGIALTRFGGVAIGHNPFVPLADGFVIINGNNRTEAFGLYVTNNAPVGGAAIVANNSSSTSGSALQARGHVVVTNGNILQSSGYGNVKAMVEVGRNGAILRCFNGYTNSSTGNCGITVTLPLGNVGVYRIDFGQPLVNRFVSITPMYASTCNVVPIQCRNAGANYVFNQGFLEVFTFNADNAADTTEASFIAIIY